FPRSDGLWLRFGQTWAYRLANVMSALPSILLQKSKIKRLRKSRESRFLDVSATAKPRRADTKAGGRLSQETAEALGIGYAPKGMMKGYVAIPIRLPTGELTGYIGITEDKVPKEFHL